MVHVQKNAPTPLILLNVLPALDLGMEQLALIVCKISRCALMYGNSIFSFKNKYWN